MAKKTRTFQTVKSDLPPVWNPEEPGAVLEGIFLGSKRIGPRNKTFLTHQIQDEETGAIQSFSGAIADRMMVRIPKGSYVRITKLEDVETSRGDAKNFQVDVDSKVELAPESFEQDDDDGDDFEPEPPASQRGRDRAASKNARKAVNA